MLFSIKSSTILRNFVNQGISYSKEPGTLTLIAVQGSCTKMLFNNGNGDHIVYISSYDVSPLLLNGTFTNGVYNKEVIIIKDENRLLFIPIDSEDYAVLSTRELKKIKLVAGFSYQVKGNSNHLESFSGKFLGEWFLNSCYFNNNNWSSILISSRFYFLKDNNEIIFFTSRKHFILEELIDSSSRLTNFQEFEPLLWRKEHQSFTYNNLNDNCFNFISLEKISRETLRDNKITYRAIARTQAERSQNVQFR